MKKTELENLKEIGEAPDWYQNASYETVKNGYLLDGETPKGMYKRIAKSVAFYLKKPDYEDKFFDLMWKNWLCPASPIMFNNGTNRGFNISCFGNNNHDSIDGIMKSVYEVAMLTKHGGGISSYYGDVRPRGSAITNNGKSDGIIPFLKILDSTMVGVSQGGVRRGSGAAYLPVEHGDFDEFLKMRKPQGDPNRQCLNLHHGVCISDEFMKKVEDGDKESRTKWKELIKTRFELGEPYCFFSGNVSRNRPDCFKALNLEVKSSNLCSEISLPTDDDHTFVCCLSSMNLARWDEWKDTDAVYWSIWFLDGIMEEFIQKAKGKPGFEKAVRFAEKSRSLGLGVLGFHTYLQSKFVPFEGMESYLLNNSMFKFIREEGEKATKDLAKKYGEPEWCKGFGRRNATLMAVAPTVSNSLVSGNVSAGIEPWAANAFAQKSAKGTFLQKNRQLMTLLQSIDKDTDEVWKSIVTNEGSVQHLDFLTDEQKEVFKTAREINQFVIVKLAAARQKWIDQGQSLNLFFPANADPKYINNVHLEAYKSGVCTLYYMRTSSVLKSDSGSRTYERKVEECTFCEG